jgi:hypothetical protein
MTTTSLIRALAAAFSPWSKAATLQRAADEVVSECQGRLSQAMCRSTGTMTHDEARGYVRAHAIGFVCGHIDETLRRHHLSRGHRSQLLVAAVNRLVATACTERRIPATAAQSRPLAA